MSADITPELKQQRAREFMQLLPLTAEIAGLPVGNLDKLLSAEIMELRANNLRTAYKFARQVIKEVSESS
ncbi:MAG: hypothetical protein U0798_08200 [Gemmataceae bacterium]